jgi:hypothetical protein
VTTRLVLGLGRRRAATVRGQLGNGKAAPDLPTAVAAYGSFRRRRVRRVVRESATIGRIVNMRPPFLGGTASRATALIPERAVTSHLSSIAGRSAFILPTATDAADAAG